MLLMIELARTVIVVLNSDNSIEGTLVNTWSLHLQLLNTVSKLNNSACRYIVTMYIPIHSSWSSDREFLFISNYTYLPPLTFLIAKFWSSPDWVTVKYRSPLVTWFVSTCRALQLAAANFHVSCVPQLLVLFRV